MGHIVNEEREYRLLQERLDQNVTGAPFSPQFIQILKLLFSPKEAELARHIPLRPTPLRNLASTMKIEEDRLYEDIIRMAERGLVFDFEQNGQCYVVLAPVVIGFFEFVFMRYREDVPLKELAKLFDEYMFQDDKFASSVFTETTQIGRVLVREEALPKENYSEVLDWEKTSKIIRCADRIAVSLCACRHKASHLGKACNAPLRTCLTLNGGTDYLVRHKMAEYISKEEALDIVAECKQAGLAQIADNVQREVGFICNCCGCCCGMFQSIRRFAIKSAVVSANFRAQIDPAKCKGCGACVRACPVRAIREDNPHCDEEMCLGCGVCYSVCKFGAVYLSQRAQKVFVPETTFDRYVAMAMERGKLANYLFDDPSRLSHRALGRLASIIERSRPIQGLFSIKPLKSAFLNAVLKVVK